MAGTATISTIKHDVTGAATTFRDGSGNEIGRLGRFQLNYNGTANSTRASFNVSSVTRSATGRYSIAFTNSLPNANHSPVSSYGDSVTTANQSQIDTVPGPSTSTLDINGLNAAGSAFINMSFISVASFVN